QFPVGLRRRLLHRGFRWGRNGLHLDTTNRLSDFSHDYVSPFLFFAGSRSGAFSTSCVGGKSLTSSLNDGYQGTPYSSAYICMTLSDGTSGGFSVVRALYL